MTHYIRTLILMLLVVIGVPHAYGVVTAITSCGTVNVIERVDINKWDVFVTIPAGCSAAPISVNVRGAGTDRIRNVAVDSQASQLVFISIQRQRVSGRVREPVLVVCGGL
jgi:hypothetical protein